MFQRICMIAKIESLISKCNLTIMAVVQEVDCWTMDKFIQRGTEIHNGKYDYSLINPDSTIEAGTGVPIKCIICSHVFIQRVNNHINDKRSCPACARKLPWTPIEFIRYATHIHNNKYDYRMININSKMNTSTRVIIKCKTCNCIFKPTVHNHINHKTGCPKCRFSKN